MGYPIRYSPILIMLMKCRALMKPDTLLGERARQIEVSADQTTALLYG